MDSHAAVEYAVDTCIESAFKNDTTTAADTVSCIAIRMLLPQLSTVAQWTELLLSTHKATTATLPPL